MLDLNMFGNVGSPFQTVKVSSHISSNSVHNDKKMLDINVGPVQVSLYKMF